MLAEDNERDKAVFFVLHNSGEKFLTAHAAGRIFSECFSSRACMPVVNSRFFHLHGKFCVLALRTFQLSPPSPVRASHLLGRNDRFAEAC